MKETWAVVGVGSIGVFDRRARARSSCLLPAREGDDQFQEWVFLAGNLRRWLVDGA